MVDDSRLLDGDSGDGDGRRCDVISKFKHLEGIGIRDRDCRSLHPGEHQMQV